MKLVILKKGKIYVMFDKAIFIQDRAMNLDNRQMIATPSPALQREISNLLLTLSLLIITHVDLRRIESFLAGR